MGHWAPAHGAYDLVTSLYVHVSGKVEEMVRRLGGGVVEGGSLLFVGHLLVKPGYRGPDARWGPSPGDGGSDRLCAPRAKLGPHHNRAAALRGRQWLRRRVRRKTNRCF